MKTRNILIIVLILIMLTSFASAKEIQIEVREYTPTELSQLIAENEAILEHAHDLAESARKLGLKENNDIIKFAKAEYNKASDAIKVYKTLLAQYEYPEATQVWNYMKDLGWSDYVCAGILGNMMAEVGGGTLNLNVCIDTGNGFYGLCQWSKTGHAGANGRDLIGQMDYLNETIKYELDTFGYAYAYGFNFEQFLELTSERDVAIAFSKCYERNDPRYTWIRADYAEKAYDYFAGK